MIRQASQAPEFRVAAYDTLGSTNDEAKRLARTGAAEGLTVWALQQNAGRGRRGRVWMSPRGNLYFSVVLRPHCKAAVAAQLGFVAVLALGEALSQLVPAAIDLRYKWPNDLLANRKKLAGILLETEMVAGDAPDFVVIGIGVNLASSPQDVAYPATSLAQEGVPGITPRLLLDAFLPRFGAEVRRWREAGFAPVRAAWLARATGVGEAVEVRLERETFGGRFLDLDDDGALLLGMPDGDRRVTAGEVFPVVAG